MSRKLVSLITTFAMVFTMFAMPAGAAASKYESVGQINNNTYCDAVYFGSYPQTEVVSNKSQCGTTGKEWAKDTDYIVDSSVYSQLSNDSGWTNNIKTVSGNKYLRMKNADAVAKNTGSYYYNWANDTDYHYFKFEPIKWRILSKNGNDIFVVSDVAIDNRPYHTTETNVTWQTCSLRTWLNEEFANTAFSSAEKGAITSTGDKVTLLSVSDATTASYGFATDIKTINPARSASCSTYAKAMGAYIAIDYSGKCQWWLTDAGSDAKKAMAIQPNGDSLDGKRVNFTKTGVRPAMHLNASSSYVKDAGKAVVSSIEYTTINMNDEYVLSGSKCEPSITITGLVKGVDYTVSYTNNTSVGTGTVTATGIGNCTGSISRQFDIKASGDKIALTADQFLLEKTSYTYDGTEKHPKVVTTLNSTDYNVAYSKDCTNQGTKTVTITGAGNYTGTIEKTFKIEKKSIANMTATLASDTYTYTGSAIVPEVTVKDGTKTLGSDDYTVTASNNINKGTATAKITGKNNYTGEITKTFKISEKSIQGAAVTLSGTEFTYSSQEIKPSVTKVVLSGKELTAGTDYEIKSYSDDCINVGDKTVTINGKGNYSGTATATFKITPYDISSLSVESQIDSITYDGEAQEPRLRFKDGDDTAELEKVYYDVEFSNNINAGEATITVTGKDNYKGKCTGTFNIQPKDYTNAEPVDSGLSATYTGSARVISSSKLTGIIKTLGLKESDVKVSYINNVNKGKATAVIAPSDGNLNWIGEVRVNFTIKAASLSSKTAKLSYTSVVYNGKDMKPTVSISGLKNGTDYTVAYSNNKYCGKATVKITGKGNYTGSITKYFSITPAKAALSKVTAGSKKITVAIKSQKTSKVSGYQIYYKKSGSAAKTVNTTSTSKTIKSLTKGKKYTVKVRAYTIIDKKIVYGAYSTAKTVKVK